MIENAVDDDFYIAVVGLFEQLEESGIGRCPDPGRGILGFIGGRDSRPIAGGIGTEIVIDVMITGAVVLMQALGFEYWIEIFRTD